MKQGPRSAQRLFQPIRGLAQRFAFISLVIVAISMMVIGKIDVLMMVNFRAQITDIVAPILSALSRPADTISSSISYIRELSQLHEDNLRLRKNNTRLLQWEAAARNLEAENKNLRELLNFKPGPEPSFITTRVIADSGGAFAHSVILNAGTRDGVSKGQTGMTGHGLAGRVAGVGSRSARLLLITDINSRIPVLVGIDRNRAILAGNNSKWPKLVHLSSIQNIKIGDRVVTSGHGGVISPGLPVGIITQVDQDKIIMRPFVQRNRLENIRLLDFGLDGILKGSSPEVGKGHSRGGLAGQIRQ
jgi:rod shape-determining protein MreC